MIIFFFTFFIAIVTTVYFIIGVCSQRVVCDTIREPASSPIMELVENTIDINTATGLDVNVTSILTKCHQNQSVYEVFHLEKVFNVSELTDYMSKYEIEDALKDLSNSVTADTNITILDETAISNLQSLTEAGISDIRFDKFIDIVSVTSYCI